MGRMDTVSSQMDWELLPVAPLYADVRAYCSHGKMYCKKARLLSYHLRLFISFLYSLMMRLEVSRERTRERAAKRRKQPRDFSRLPQMLESLLAGYTTSNNLYLNLRSYWRVQKQLRFGFVYNYGALKSVHAQHKTTAAKPLITPTTDAGFQSRSTHHERGS